MGFPKQITFVDAGYAGKRKQAGKEFFLVEVNRMASRKVSCLL